MLTRELLDSISRSKPVLIHTINLNGKDFTFLCDVIQMKKAIESLRGNFSSPQYGYQKYGEGRDANITEVQHQEHVDNLYKEFEKRLEYDYVKEILSKAVKKKDGTFNRGRVYYEYTFESAADDGGPGANVLKLKYVVSDDLVMELVFYYGTEYYPYNGW